MEDLCVAADTTRTTVFCHCGAGTLNAQCPKFRCGDQQLLALHRRDYHMQRRY